MMLPDQRDGAPVRPVVQTFYDHLQVSFGNEENGCILLSWSPE